MGVAGERTTLGKGRRGDNKGGKEGRREGGREGGRGANTNSYPYLGDEIGTGAVEATRLLVDEERTFLRKEGGREGGREGRRRGGREGGSEDED